jgi:hypothetical protein
VRRRSCRRRGKNGRYVAAPGATPGKRSVSVSAAMFGRVKEFALDNDVAMTWIVDEAVAEVLASAARSEQATFTAVPAARRPARSRPAPPVDPPIAFWLLPTGPIRK